MRSMGHPDYVYRPISEEKREKMRAAQKRRLGIPNDHVRIYGVVLGENEGRELKPHAYEHARRHGVESARTFVQSPKPDWDLIGELMAEGVTIGEAADFTGHDHWYVEKMTSRFRRINRRRVSYDGE